MIKYKKIKEVFTINNIKPVSDLKNKFTEISKAVHETEQPVFLTKDGYGDMVVMSMESYEKMQFENEVYFKPAAAERESEETEERFSSEDILYSMKRAAGIAQKARHS